MEYYYIRSKKITFEMSSKSDNDKKDTKSDKDKKDKKVYPKQLWHDLTTEEIKEYNDFDVNAVYCIILPNADTTSYIYRRVPGRVLHPFYLWLSKSLHDIWHGRIDNYLKEYPDCPRAIAEKNVPFPLKNVQDITDNLLQALAEYKQDYEVGFLRPDANEIIFVASTEW